MLLSGSIPDEESQKESQNATHSLKDNTIKVLTGGNTTVFSHEGSPENNHRTASRKLRYWLHNDRDLLADLQAEGYDKEQSYLTPKQLEILRNYINDPLA